MKYFALTLATILLLAGIYMLSAFVLGRIAVAEEAGTKPDMDIYILTNGVHTDIVMPVKTDVIDWSKEVKFENTQGKDTAYNYLAIGWGDKGFYMEIDEWSELTFRIAFKAAFGLSTSAIHATYYKDMVEGDDCKRIRISEQQYIRLVEYLQKGFRHDTDGHVIHIATDATYGDSDSFYEGVGSYSLFRTCNTWANDGLKAAGLKACLWTPFQSAIFYQYRSVEK